MEVWKAEDPRVNIEKRFAYYEIYTWTLCHSYLHEKQTSRIQSLNIYINQNVSRMSDYVNLVTSGLIPFIQISFLLILRGYANKHWALTSF